MHTHASISGSKKHWKPAFCFASTLPLPSTVTGSPSVCSCASAVILPSFLSLPGVLCFCASSLHQLTSLSPSPFSFFFAPLPLSSFSEPPSCIPPSSYPPITPIMPPFLDSILLPLLLPPSRRPSSCHHIIMPFRFVTFCFLLGIYNLLQISLSVSCSLCAGFHLLCIKKSSLPRLSLGHMDFDTRMSGFFDTACAICWESISKMIFTLHNILNKGNIKNATL